MWSRGGDNTALSNFKSVSNVNSSLQFALFFSSSVSLLSEQGADNKHIQTPWIMAGPGHMGKTEPR